MIKTVKQACRFNPIIRDYRMSQEIENLAGLINDEGDGREFFSRNFITHGMEQLFHEELLRLSGKSDQAVFELAQAMSGGKTHMMIALGLLARHPHLCSDVLPPDLAARVDFGTARIATFSGRNNPDNYIWGEIASQLCAEDANEIYEIPNHAKDEIELIEFLAAPQRKPDEFLQAMQRLREAAWYLHGEEQCFFIFIKETENLSRQIERNTKEIPQPKIDQALINRLTGILEPVRKIAYQDVQVLPKLDELKLGGPRTLIVIKPDGKVPPSKLPNFFDYQQEKNNLLVLTGQDSLLADAVEERLRELYAIEQIHKRLRPGDTLFEDSRDRLEEAEDRFGKALSAAYNRLYFPVNNPVDGRDVLAGVTIDQGLKIGQGDQSAEVQIESLLASPRADYKLVRELTKDEYFAQAEEYLWPSGKDNRRTPWKDVVTRAKCSPIWPWMPGASGLDTLKTEALKQGRWRLGEDGYIEKGPFPKDKATVNVSVVNVKVDSGETVLSLTPRHAGDSPVVYWSTKPDVSDKDHKVEDLDNFSTTEGTLYFWVKDTTGQHESAPAVRWLADLKIRHQVEPAADKRRVRLEATPRADLYYTLDGSNPKDGTRYDGPFEIGPGAYRLLVFARAGEANKTADFQIPASGDKTVQIVDAKPTRLQSKRVSLDTTDRVFGVINRFRDQSGTRFKGVHIEIGREKTP